MRTHVKRHFPLLAAFLIAALPCRAQWSGSASDRIRTLQTYCGDDWQNGPFITLGSDDAIRFSFDEMSHDYHRFTYRITHCDAYWNGSDLTESQYLDGFNDLPVDEWENSMNTTFNYTHYTLTIPNDDVSLKLSGNYRLSVMEDDSEVAFFRFCVVEPKVSISAGVTDNTDIDTRGHHQQVELQLGYSGLGVRDPGREIITVIMQNRRTDNAVTGPVPSHQTLSVQDFSHCRQLVFPAGNEFRRFELTDMYENFQNVDRVTFHDPYYHATLIPENRHHAYNYDNDHNGRYVVRSSRFDDSNTQADYVFVHFFLNSTQLQGGRLFIYGDFSGGSLSPEWEMEYNSREGRYETVLLLKQGSYDYQYLWVPDGETAGQTRPTEGDWYETGNEYLTLVYFRQRGSRYDRLVGISTCR